jgi:hypothetical protein
MTRRPTAPDSALTVRIVGSLLIMGGYVVFRLPMLTSPWEAAATWIGAVVCGAVAISSIEELGLRRYFRAQRIDSIREAVTETFTVPARWPGDVELAIATSRHDAMTPLIDRGEIVEPKLFTHEFQPLTPPHGLRIDLPPDMDPAAVETFRSAFLAKIGQPARFIDPDDDDSTRVSAVEILQRLKAEGYVPADTPARHAAAHIARDRFGQLFGSY